MTRLISLLIAMLALPIAGIAQPNTPSDPIILEWADSLVGSGPQDAGIREFIGNVRFRQGDVTVQCNRAVQRVTTNSAELFGKVVVNQDGLQLLAPRASYDGNAHMAYGTGGIVVIDGHRRLRSRTGTYSTKTRIAHFTDSVVAVDDTVTLWSDRAVYDRNTGVRIATGRVVAADSIRGAVLRGDSLYHDPRIDHLKVTGDAAVWSWDADTLEAGEDSSATKDTLYLIADSIDVFHGKSERYIAVGAVELVRSTVAARADSIDHVVATGLFELFYEPIVWADSAQLTADTIYILAPDRSLRSVRGVSSAMMVSRSDTLRPDRFDQVAGEEVVLEVEQDTVRRLRAVTQAQSITWQSDEGQAEGLAKFACDTILAEFWGGTISDVFWLHEIVGEHHPEAVAGGNEASYRLKGFQWRVDRPERPAIPKPYSPAPNRTPTPVKEGRGPELRTKKKVE